MKKTNLVFAAALMGVMMTSAFAAEAPAETTPDETTTPVVIAEATPAIAPVVEVPTEAVPATQPTEETPAVDEEMAVDPAQPAEDVPATQPTEETPAVDEEMAVDPVQPAEDVPATEPTEETPAVDEEMAVDPAQPADEELVTIPETEIPLVAAPVTVTLNAVIYAGEEVAYEDTCTLELNDGDVLNLNDYVWTDIGGVTLNEEVGEVTVSGDANTFTLAYTLADGWLIVE